MANYFDGDIVRRDMEIELTDDLLSRARRERDGLRSDIDAARASSARLLVAAKEARSLLVRSNHPAAIQIAREVLDAAIADCEPRGAANATGNLPISYPINASTKLGT